MFVFVFVFSRDGLLVATVAKSCSLVVSLSKLESGSELTGFGGHCKKNVFGIRTSEREVQGNVSLTA